MKPLLATLAVVFAIMFSVPASQAIDLPKLDGFTSMVEAIQAKQPKQSRSRKSRKTKQDQCMAQCLQDCWFNCQAGCRCFCYGLPKGCIGGPT